MRGILFTFLCLVVLPALWTIAHGESGVENSNAPTVDNPLRANEKVASKTDDEVVSREEEKINPDGLSVKELQQLREQGEIHTFQAEVNKLMNIIINSLYSNREVFLRELISNASDALDKIRFISLTDKEQLETNPKLEIKIKADPKANNLHIIDSGIGMTREEIINNLGTIAKSGTTEFIQKLGSTNEANNLIGQFGVGFYSAFLVADSVTVITKNNADKQYIWQSDAHGSFSIIEDPRGNTLGRGTEIVLHLKEDALPDYVDQDVLKKLVTKYSEFINFPIYLWASHEEEKEVPLTPEEIAATKKDKEEEDSEEINIDGEKENEEPSESKTKKVKEMVYKWELMNETKPIWTRNPKDISDDEYNAFYKTVTKDWQDPFKYSHFNAEGEVNFKSLLYIPASPPSNMFEPSNESVSKGIKLYVRRVFITDEFKDLLPKYLAFIKGIVDSDDLPLNVSREMLQENRTLRVIRKKLIRKAIAMFQEMAEDEDRSKYIEFWKNYGTSVKLGVVEDTNNRTRLSKLLMFHSSKTGELTTFQEYVDRMKPGQEQIYFLAGDSKEAVERSPLIEKVVKRGYEVLYMIDPIDEYALTNMGDKFDGKYKLTNLAREGVKLDGDEEDEEKEKEIQKDLETLIKYLKKQLSSKVEKVIVSKRLSKSPSALSASMSGWTPTMEKIVRTQALGDPNRSSSLHQPKKILEINARHPIVQELKKRIELNENDADARDIAELVYDTAALTSGWNIENPAQFADRIVKMMNLGLNLDANAAPAEEEVVVEEKQESEQHSKDEL